MLLQRHQSRVCLKKHKSVQKAGMSYVYDEDGTLIADTLTGGATTTWGQSARYIYLPTASGPMPVAAIYGTKHYAIQSDHLNTPRRLIQSDGQVAWQWAYSAFGDEQPAIAKNRFANVALNQAFGSTTVPAVTFNLRYPGQYFDQESNLHYNYHRSYSAVTGRYTQSDPIGLDGGWNRFGYANQNPMSYADPLGQEAITVVVGGSVLALGCLMSPSCSGAVGGALSSSVNAAGSAVSSAVQAIKDFCTPGDPCKDIAIQINDIASKLRTKLKQQLTDQYDLYNRAYLSNPGGDIQGKGTWDGHDKQITGLKVGLKRKIAEAQAMGCPVGPDIILLANSPNPIRPN
jgi:RHS repeat-associated protein